MAKVYSEKLLEVINLHTDLLDENLPEFIDKVLPRVKSDLAYKTFLEFFSKLFDTEEPLADIIKELAIYYNYFTWEGLDRFNKISAKRWNRTPEKRTIEHQLSVKINEIYSQEFPSNLPINFITCGNYRSPAQITAYPIISGDIQAATVKNSPLENMYVGVIPPENCKAFKYAKSFDQPHEVFDLTNKFLNYSKLTNSWEKDIIICERCNTQVRTSKWWPIIYVPVKSIKFENETVARISTILPKEILEQYNMPIWEG